MYNISANTRFKKMKDLFHLTDFVVISDLVYLVIR